MRHPKFNPEDYNKIERGRIVKYIEIDGVKKFIDKCYSCPCCHPDIALCTHPLCTNPHTVGNCFVDFFAQDCPLREVEECFKN